MIGADRSGRNVVIEGLSDWHVLCVLFSQNRVAIENHFGSEFGAVRTARERRLGGELLTIIHGVSVFGLRRFKKEAFE